MNTIKLKASLLLFSASSFLCFACGDITSEQERRNDENVTAEGEVIIQKAPDFTPIPRAFNLKEGESSREALFAGDCHRAFVQPASGIPMFLVKQFANGAIIYPNDPKGGPVCVDLHGATYDKRVSFSGVMLDAVARWNLGSFKDLFVRPGEEEGIEVNFANGTMKVFRGTGRPEDGRYKWAAQAPTEHNVFSGGPCIAGFLHSITLNRVRVHYPIGDRISEEPIEVDGTTAFVAYRYAWQKTEASKRGLFAMNDSAVGVFKAEANVGSDAGSSMKELAFTKALLRHLRVYDPTTQKEMIVIAEPGQPGQPGQTQGLVTCDRPIPANGTALHPYACNGL
jgi:hypothetical protein